jgi:hypothetical protein
MRVGELDLARTGYLQPRLQKLSRHAIIPLVREKRSSSRIAATTQFAFSKSLASLPPDYSGEDLLPNLSRGESVESQASWPKALVLNPINSLERSFCLGLRCLCGTMGKPRSRVILEKSLVSNVNVASREGFEDPAHQAETA